MIALADAARLGAIRAFVRVFGARPLVDRELRVAWNGALLVALAFVAVGVVPMWLLALGPIVWGVPHVLADVRYLVVRPRYHRRAAVYVPAILGLVAGWAGFGVRAALVAGGVVALVAHGAWPRRVAVAVALFALAALAQTAPIAATLVYAHLHNAVAVLLFVLWWRGSASPSRSGLMLVPVLVVALGALGIATGALDGAVTRAAPIGSAWFGDIADQLAPQWLVDDPRVALRLVLLYAFGQSVHYVMWLRLVPEADRTSPRPRSFRQSARALRSELGLPLLVSFAVTALVFVVWAGIDLAQARIRYLEIAFFHGWLEIVALALFLVEGAPQNRAPRG